jgi:hypothetical protein
MSVVVFFYSLEDNAGTFFITRSRKRSKENYITAVCDSQTYSVKHKPSETAIKMSPVFQISFF